MATVIQESFRPAPKTDPLFLMLLQQSMKSRAAEEKQEAKAEAAGRSAQALSFLLADPKTGGAQPGQPGSVQQGLSPEHVQQFLTSTVEAGGSPASAAKTIVGISKSRTQAAKDVAANQSLIELGQQFKDSPDPRQHFMGTVLTTPGIGASTKTSILNLTGTLFPEAKGKKLKDIKIYSPEGEEDLIRVPADVDNPQEYIEKNFPDLVAAGFTTRKPKGEKGRAPTEGERNVAAAVQTNPILQRLLSEKKITPQEARNRARLMLRERGNVLKQLEADFGVAAEAGMFKTDASRERILFELARENVSGIFAEGVTEPGQVVRIAKDVALAQFEKLRFLPSQLQLTPQNAKSMDHLQSIAEFLMNDDPDFLGDEFDTPEERFKEVLRLIQNRVRMNKTDEEDLRKRIFGEPDKKKSEDEPGIIERFLR